MSSFADIRLVVADLDGTLLDDEKQLDAGIVDVIKELAKREIMFTLASGRNIHIMKPYLKELSLQLPFIANNGANMFQGDAFTTSLQDARLQFFLNRLRGKTRMKQAVDDRDMLGHAIFKVVMVAKDANVMEPVLHTINAHCESLHAVRSEDDVYTITHVDATKGKTLVRLMELLHVQPKQTMVFGDNFNDATMFSTAGISVCMENGQSEVKEMADYIAKANTEQGVSRFLKEYVLR